MDPVLANVIKGVEWALVGTNTEKLLTGNLKSKVITRIGRLRRMTCILSGSHEKSRTFLLVDRVARVVRRIQGADNPIIASLDQPHRSTILISIDAQLMIVDT